MKVMRPHGYLLPVLLAACGCSDQSGRPEPRPAAPPPAAKILQLYASPNPVETGQKTLLCYGLENATSVELQPPVEGLGVSPNRCLPIAPRRTTTYTLTAAGAAGTPARQTVTVHVVPATAAPPPASSSKLIRTFAASAEEIAAGAQVTLCYGAAQPVSSVRLEPGLGDLPAKATGCVAVTPPRTTTYTLSVTAAGKTDRSELTVRVR
jgi:hypothetical protein